MTDTDDNPSLGGSKYIMISAIYSFQLWQRIIQLLAYYLENYLSPKSNPKRFFHFSTDFRKWVFWKLKKNFSQTKQLITLKFTEMFPTSYSGYYPRSRGIIPWVWGWDVSTNIVVLVEYTDLCIIKFVYTTYYQSWSNTIQVIRLMITIQIIDLKICLLI